MPFPSRLSLQWQHSMHIETVSPRGQPEGNQVRAEMILHAACRDESCSAVRQGQERAHLSLRCLRTFPRALGAPTGDGRGHMAEGCFSASTSSKIPSFTAPPNSAVYGKAVLSLPQYAWAHVL